MRWTFALVAVLATSIPSIVGAQTDGFVQVGFSTRPTSGRYDPRNIVAVWVTDSGNHFVKTLLRRADNRREHLYTWNNQTGGNVVDAITGATLSSHQQHNVSWDCRDRGGELVPDGVYRIRVEYTSEHAQGPLTPSDLLEFTKGPEAASLSPPNQTYFRDLSLSYAPETNTLTAVPAESEWAYDDSGSDLHASGWKALDFDDSGWSRGPGKLGYGDAASTTLDSGPDSDDKHPCYYLRHRFEIGFVPDTAAIRVLRDDGVVVYLNGTEVVRDNMAPGETAFDDLASDTVGGSEEEMFVRFAIPTTAFVAGANILAVEVHQASRSSSDLGFDLELATSPPTEAVSFLRGDANSDGEVQISDSLTILNYLFVAGTTPGCLSAADTNDDGSMDVSDGVSVLLFLFTSEHVMPPPYPECGEDPTADVLSCLSPPACE